MNNEFEICNAEHPDNPDIHCQRIGKCPTESHYAKVKINNRWVELHFGFDWEKEQREKENAQKVS